MRSPRIIVLNPELSKQILVQNFKNFHDNEFGKMFDSKHDPLFARNPFLSNGDEWKERRNEISPAFSSNRMKALYPLIENVCERFSAFIKDDMSQPFEAKEMAGKFTVEAVSNCIFGIEANAFQKEESQLKKMSARLFKPSAKTILNFTLVSIIPQLKKFLKIQFVADDVNDFFMNLLDQAVKFRSSNKAIREDYLDYLMTLQKKKDLSNTALAGHSITFFSDGLETSSILIAHALYEVCCEKLNFES
jgi:cytochrome P450